MKELVELIEYKFKAIVDEPTYKKYKRMAEFCDKWEDDVVTMNYKELYKFYVNNQKPLLLEGEPFEEDWKNFLKDKSINQIFLDSVTSSQAPTLRKLICNIGDKNAISQGDMKALDALKDLVRSAEAREQNVYYIQYLAPVAYMGADSAKIIEDLTKKDK